MERTITIGFLGCGNVGGGVWKLLNGFADDIAHRTGLRFSIKRVLVRSLAKKRDIDFPEGVLTDRVEDVLDDPEISIVLEFLGGEEPLINGSPWRWSAAKPWSRPTRWPSPCTGMNCRKPPSKAARACITRRRCVEPSPSSIRWRKACRPTASAISTASSMAPPTTS